MKKGTMSTSSMIGILIAVVVFVSLLPTIADQVAGVGGNVTGAALTLVGLTTLLVVIIFFAALARKAGGKK